MQLFEISIYGGEARQLFSFEHGISNPQWSPDGRYVLFSTSLTREQVTELTGSDPDWSEERPGRPSWEEYTADPAPDGDLANVRAWLNRNREEGNPRLLTRA